MRVSSLVAYCTTPYFNFSLLGLYNIRYSIFHSLLLYIMIFARIMRSMVVVQSTEVDVPQRVPRWQKDLMFCYSNPLQDEEYAIL